MNNKNNTAETLGKKDYIAPSIQDNEISINELMAVKSYPKANILIVDPWEEDEELDW